ncbi:T9SS type A sorting domain-containing protein [Chryseobacterium zhengzhouense]|uniref:T9SS type A sorting domain-containing protein n=1 Tax=Chryseobacterium zhengzhouense TaxID=1636086 RepID=A0ABW2LZL1_9FLAO
MKIKNYLLLLILSFGSNFLLAQHENDNWLFGNNKWKFDNSPNGFIHTTNLNPYIRYGSSAISDKNTGDLLFYSDGYKIYTKNGTVMTGGSDLFNSNNVTFNTFGNPSDQSSIIIPLPNSNSIYYVFYINGNRKVNDQGTNSDLTTYNYGLRYAIVNMNLGGGLGEVTSKNNVLFANSPTNALTSTVASDGNSYWIISANNGNFLSYKLSSNGLNTNPVISPATHYGNFFKISPNSKKLVTRINRHPTSTLLNGLYLYDFNNINGVVSNQNKINTRNDKSDFHNSIEFSSDSNYIYYIDLDSCLCGPNSPSISYIMQYNISNGNDYYIQNITNGLAASLQRSQNGKIYLILSSHSSNNNEVIFTPAYQWRVINNPNDSSPNIDGIYPQLTNTKNGYSFPQLVSHLENTNICPNNLDINYPITVSQNFQAGQSIIASSIINDGLTVNYKAGNNVNLLPGFYVRASENGLFHSYISPCDGIIENFFKNSNTDVDSIVRETKISSFDLKVFPNPTSTFINIDSGNEKINSWELFDISGRSVLKGNSVQINVQALPKATYLLNININNKTTTKKVIVK